MFAVLTCSSCRQECSRSTCCGTTPPSGLPASAGLVQPSDLTDMLGVGSSDRFRSMTSRDAVVDRRLRRGARCDGSESASIFSMSGASLPAMLLAASHPDRVRSLVLWGGFARFVRAPTHAFGIPEAALIDTSTGFERHHRKGRGRRCFAPSGVVTPPSGDGGREVSDSAGPRVLAALLDCGCA